MKSRALVQIPGTTRNLTGDGIIVLFSQAESLATTEIPPSKADFVLAP